MLQPLGKPVFNIIPLVSENCIMLEKNGSFVKDIPFNGNVEKFSRVVNIFNLRKSVCFTINEVEDTIQDIINHLK